MTRTPGDVERLERRLERSLLGALSRVDLASLPIPARRHRQPGGLLPVLQAAGLDVGALALAGERSEGG